MTMARDEGCRPIVREGKGCPALRSRTPVACQRTPRCWRGFEHVGLCNTGARPQHAMPAPHRSLHTTAVLNVPVTPELIEAFVAASDALAFEAGERYAEHAIPATLVRSRAIIEKLLQDVTHAK